MSKELEFDVSKYRYGVMHTSCIDNTIAAASGYYHEAYYIMYGFYFCVKNNWSEKKHDDIFSLSEEILADLGLYMNFLKIEAPDDLVKQIKASIDRKTPIVFLPLKKACFYSLGYKEILDEVQAALVTGYDEDRDLVIIRDSAVDQSVFSSTGEHYFLRLQLTNGMIKDIFQNSVNGYSKKHIARINRIISTIESKNTKFEDSWKLFTDALINLDFNKNRLIQMIQTFNENAFRWTENPYVEEIRSRFYSSLMIFFDVIEKVFHISKNDDDYSDFISFKSDYLRHRYKILSILHITALRNHTLNQAKQEALIIECRSYDEQMRKLFKKKIHNISVPTELF